MEPIPLLKRSTYAVRAPVRGFTLIEMLVVLAIIIVVTGIVLSGESNFNRSFLLTNTTYDVALSFRSAETYGLASQAYGGSLNAGYGIYLSLASPSSYVMFADSYPSAASKYGSSVSPASRPGNGLYDASQNELIQQFGLGAGFSIAQFCMRTADGTVNCYTPAANPTQQLSIVFSRPSEEANIETLSGGAATPGTGACITIQSSAGDSRYISITQVGQIAVATSCGQGSYLGGSNDTGGSNGVSCTLSVDNKTISPGGIATLSWTAVNAISFSVDHGIGPLSPAYGGSQQVQPSVTTTYTGTATSQSSGSAQCPPVTVTVTQPLPAAPTCTLVANPTSVLSGGSTMLTLASTNGTSAVVDHAVGSMPLNGSKTVVVSSATTYTATVTGLGGTVQCSAAVGITPPSAPTCTLAADYTSIQSGLDDPLRWTTTHATSFSIDHGIGSVTPVSSGSTMVYGCKQTITYTGTAVGSGGSTSCQSQAVTYTGQFCY